MFKPRVVVKGSRKDLRTDEEIVRDDWMNFLGKLYKRYFNPVLPSESGSETTRLKQRLAACLRAFFFGNDSSLKYKQTINGIASIGSINLPSVESSFIGFHFLLLTWYSYFAQTLSRTSAESSRTEEITSKST